MSKRKKKAHNPAVKNRRAKNRKPRRVRSTQMRVG